MQCKCSPVEGILDLDLSGNNLQSLRCIEIAKLLPGNQHRQSGFLRTEKFSKPRFFKNR